MIPHKHLLVRAKISNPITDTDTIKTWISSLVDSIEMKVLHGPVSVYCDKTGNRGMTGFAIIETSHIALHTWDETDPAMLQLDVYTCSELDVEKVFKMLEVFKPIQLDYKFLDRESGFTEIVDSPVEVVRKWVDRITKKHDNMNGNRICPFAKMPKVITVDKLCVEDFVEITSEVTVYMENGIRSTYDELETVCRTLKSMNPNAVFLPDHPHKPSYIKGHMTGNGVFPCIIVQSKQELDTARKALEKTDYYTHWDPAYLKEIRSFD